jgi:hypothetical protein
VEGVAWRRWIQRAGASSDGSSSIASIGLRSVVAGGGSDNAAAWCRSTARWRAVA